MTTTGSDHSLYHQLGEIAASIRSLQESIKRVEDAAQRSEDKSDTSRAVVHKRMDDLVTHVGRLESSLETATDDISQMKPVTEDVQRWKLMGIGALGVVGIGGVSIGAAIAGTLENIAHFFKGS